MWIPDLSYYYPYTESIAVSYLPFLCTYMQIPDLRFFYMRHPVCVHIYTHTHKQSLNFRLHLWQAEFDHDLGQERNSKSFTVACKHCVLDVCEI